MENLSGSDPKNGTKRNFKQIEGGNHHSPDTTRILILEEAFTTDNGEKRIEIKRRRISKNFWIY